MVSVISIQEIMLLSKREIMKSFCTYTFICTTKLKEKVAGVKTLILGICEIKMGFDGTKPVFGLSDKARLKPISSGIETSYKTKISTCSKFRYNIFQLKNNKGSDQTAWMRWLVCAFVVRKPPKTGLLASRPKLYRSS